MAIIAEEKARIVEEISKMIYEGYTSGYRTPDPSVVSWAIEETEEGLSLTINLEDS